MFTQFSSDLDDTTKHQLRFGQTLMQLLKQEQYHPYRQHEQVILLVIALSHVLQEIPPAQVSGVGRELLLAIKDQLPDVCTEIDRTGVLSEENKQEILRTAKRYLENSKMQKSK